ALRGALRVILSCHRGLLADRLALNPAGASALGDGRALNAAYPAPPADTDRISPADKEIRQCSKICSLIRKCWHGTVQAHRQMPASDFLLIAPAVGQRVAPCCASPMSFW